MFLIDLIHHGFKKSFEVMAYVCRFVRKLKHKVHLSKGITESSCCKTCKTSTTFCSAGLEKVVSLKSEGNQPCLPGRPVFCSQIDFHLAWHYFCKVGTKEVYKEFKKTPKALDAYTLKDHVLFSGGRLSYAASPIPENAELPLFHEINYVQPVFLNRSTLTYSLAMYIHWEVCPHSGIERTMSTLLRIINNTLRKGLHRTF